MQVKILSMLVIQRREHGFCAQIKANIIHVSLPKSK